jgi:hypothetical protein
MPAIVSREAGPLDRRKALFWAFPEAPASVYRGRFATASADFTAMARAIQVRAKGG